MLVCTRSYCLFFVFNISNKQPLQKWESGWRISLVTRSAIVHQHIECKFIPSCEYVFILSRYRVKKPRNMRLCASIKITGCWIASPVLENNPFLFVQSLHTHQWCKRSAAVNPTNTLRVGCQPILYCTVGHTHSHSHFYTLGQCTVIKWPNHAWGQTVRLCVKSTYIVTRVPFLESPSPKTQHKHRTFLLSGDPFPVPKTEHCDIKLWKLSGSFSSDGLRQYIWGQW